MDVFQGVVLFGGLSLAYLATVYLSLKVFARLYGGGDTESPSSATLSRSTEPSYDETETYTSTGRTRPATVVCPACAAENDREYTFCRNCVTKLPSGHGGGPVKS